MHLHHIEIRNPALQANVATTAGVVQLRGGLALAVEVTLLPGTELRRQRERGPEGQIRRCTETLAEPVRIAVLLDAWGIADLAHRAQRGRSRRSRRGLARAVGVKDPGRQVTYDDYDEIKP